MKGYSTHEIADLLNLKPEVIRQIARSGVLDAEKVQGSRYSYSFQDLVILRTAKELLNKGVGRTRMTQVLYQLKYKLPSRKPLTSLRITCDGKDIVLREQDGIYNPESGQFHFNFSVAELAGTLAPLVRKAAEEAEFTDNLTADDWFDLGVDLEAVSPDDAPSAYQRALDQDPDHVDAHVNLGRLLQESGKYAEASSHYTRALKVEPENVLAAFNLGTLLEDMGRIHDAIEAYSMAPSFADSHYNLSRLYELIGQHTKALDHLKTYRNLIDQPR